MSAKEFIIKLTATPFVISDIELHILADMFRLSYEEFMIELKLQANVQIHSMKVINNIDVYYYNVSKKKRINVLIVTFR